MPVGGVLRGLLEYLVGPRRRGPELQQVSVELGVIVQSGVPLACRVHACGAVAHPVVGPVQVQRPGVLTCPFHEHTVGGQRAEGHLHDVLPRRVQRRGLVVDFDGEADAAGVQPGRQPQRPGNRRPAQSAALPGERLRETGTETVRVTFDIDLAVVNMYLAVDGPAHLTPSPTRVCARCSSPSRVARRWTPR